MFNLEKELNKTYNVDIKGIDMIIIYLALKEARRSRADKKHPLTDNLTDQVETLDIMESDNLNMLTVNVSNRMRLLNKSLKDKTEDLMTLIDELDDKQFFLANNNTTTITSDIKILNDDEKQTLLSDYALQRAKFEKLKVE